MCADLEIIDNISEDDSFINYCKEKCRADAFAEYKDNYEYDNDLGDYKEAVDESVIYYNTDKFTAAENLKEDDTVNKIETDNLGKPLTKEQAEFFRDSKVRNKEGKLIHMYHGTTVHFDSFNHPIN